MVFRILIVIQVACVATLGVATRAPLESPSARVWAERAAAFVVLPVLFGFPPAVALALRRASLPRWKSFVIAWIKIALVVTTLLAVLPMVQ